MTKLDKAQVKHVAKLAKLNLTEKEIEKFTSQLTDILSYMDQLREVDTKDTTQTSQTTGLTNITRQDKIRPNIILKAKAATRESNNVHNNYFVVDAVLNKNE